MLDEQASGLLTDANHFSYIPSSVEQASNSTQSAPLTEARPI